MIDVCCSTCQSIGINMQETSSEMRDYNGRLLFFVLKCCCMSEQVLIRWAELHCLPSLRLAFSYSSTFPPFVPIPNSLLGVVKLLCARSRGLGCFFPLSLGCPSCQSHPASAAPFAVLATSKCLAEAVIDPKWTPVSLWCGWSASVMYSHARLSTRFNCKWF